MLINEVESKVGLSKKSIRYYEEFNLLTPRRNQDNKYRVYTNEDIEKLKKIKFLRELDISIRDLKLLNEDKLSLEDCLKNKLSSINNQITKYKEVCEMCNEIISKKESFDSLEITNYFQKMNTLNKEGFTMRDIKTNKRKKIVGACLSSSFFIIFFGFIIGIISYFQLTQDDKIPWIVYAFIIFLLITPLIGIIVNLISRIKEILGGEEDEASKY